MSAQPHFTPRFIRKTQLAANEYHKNFHKLDQEIIAAITSAEADKVTPLMSKVYLRLWNAPGEYWEREGVLRFEARLREGKQVKAWDGLCEILGVASATANKALKWLHEQGIIGYFSGKNGVGVRIFLNRAHSSIGVRATSTGKKILRFPSASTDEAPASRNEAAFNDSFAVREVSDSDLNPPAPESGADTKPVVKKVAGPNQLPNTQSRTCPEQGERKVEVPAQRSHTVSVDEIIERLKDQLEPCLRAVATQAAAQATAREVTRTREWFETKALPKAVRVAQSEAYQLLKKYGSLEAKGERTRADLRVGRADEDDMPAARPLEAKEIAELAETCVALFEAQGRSVDATLSGMSAEGGGWLLPDDALKVRTAAQTILDGQSERS